LVAVYIDKMGETFLELQDRQSWICWVVLKKTAKDSVFFSVHKLDAKLI
jgi:hypothetical protein